MINEQGGINGRKINLISLDDGYSPPRTVEQIRKLVEEEQVLFTFQTLGTPPNTAIQKYMNAKKVPQLFVATGATKWGDPRALPWTMGWQPPYQHESQIYAKYLLQNKPDAKIGILYQNDDYGKDYLKGFKDGLGDKAANMIVAEVSYEVTDPISGLADRHAAGFGRRRILQHHDTEVRRPGDPQGLRHRLEAVAVPQHRFDLDRFRAAASRTGESRSG